MPLWSLLKYSMRLQQQAQYVMSGSCRPIAAKQGTACDCLYPGCSHHARHEPFAPSFAYKPCHTPVLLKAPHHLMMPSKQLLTLHVALLLCATVAVSGCPRRMGAFMRLLRIEPTEGQLANNPGFVSMLCMAIRNGILTDDVNADFLQTLPGLQQWDTDAVFRLMTCMVRCGRSVAVCWRDKEFRELLFPAVEQLSLEQLSELLQLCVENGRCDNLEPLLMLPAAASLGRELVLDLYAGIRAAYPCNRLTDLSLKGLTALLSTAAAQALPKHTAEQLLAAAVQAGQLHLVVLLLQLPQLQGAAAGFSSKQLLQLLQQACHSQQWEELKLLCSLPDMAEVTPVRGALLLEACYAGPPPMDYQSNQREWLAWREGALCNIIPAVLPAGLCPPEVLQQLLQACSASGYVRLMQQLITYPAAQRLAAAEIAHLLYQCASLGPGDVSQGFDGGRPKLLLALLKLPGAQYLPQEAISRLIAALAASGFARELKVLLLRPAAHRLSAEAICAAAEACISSLAPVDRDEPLRVVLQLPNVAQLSTEQLQGLLSSVVQQQLYWAAEMLLKHPAAPQDGVLAHCIKPYFKVKQLSGRFTLLG